MKKLILNIFIFISLNIKYIPENNKWEYGWYVEETPCCYEEIIHPKWKWVKDVYCIHGKIINKILNYLQNE